ncbi:hypothetical protein COX68_01565 [Candidatus Falkowbacteria bacterium CG_4_10_14_0_2_um_filter_41_15]|uniref:Uncharacterized protein n=4 Tax=Candidatus Falkowiibacteriota TaxID=1752728 RepID=A0A2G9ZMU2_9BACT|nr:MAG: hypothetical protein AUJ35_00325 [Candidatus Falkowbacteria bacterium CG1_02_41_21]PIP34472.1 MAG: hypothetical protein COX21_02730 [Candidatus Falkowbacteria bacterium CG23_combo_of_CG06-09_8_20_14_all_41_10]PIZ11356.1 MAG: hypothetical protein COY54_00560 [Candidatus Falkowbacteria bacterium CG_4_10_14_0_8_um_filter_41_36]PJA09982.1 MAG: hypothetical protein COX68_01565 [Candidatus Falkowbacteria bacterium CG_4_10_14_0_2_um_filter_41_15]
MITESIIIAILVLVIIYLKMRIYALKKMLHILGPKTTEESSAKIIIDCAAPPFVPDGYTVEEH